MTRRSVRSASYSPSELGQHCRAGYMQDLLRQAPRLAIIADLLLENKLDGEAIEAITTFIGNAREISRTLKTFREVHEKQQLQPEASKSADHAA